MRVSQGGETDRATVPPSVRVNGVDWTYEEVRRLKALLPETYLAAQALHELGVEQPGGVFDFWDIAERMGLMDRTPSTIGTVNGGLTAYSRLLRDHLGKPNVPMRGAPEGGIAWPIEIRPYTKPRTYVMPKEIAEWWGDDDSEAAARPGSTLPVDYWWTKDPEERFWIEIRYVDGLGAELRCPVLDARGRANGWYDLVSTVRPEDTVYHWHAVQHRFVGRSVVAAQPRIEDGHWVVPLKGFTAISGGADRARILELTKEITAERDRIRSLSLPGRDSLYLPFQFRADGLRMMSNYFTKLPRRLVGPLFGPSDADSDSSPLQREEENDSFAPLPRDPRPAYLEPFRPKADTGYLAEVTGGRTWRSRHHETLVNSFHCWLQGRGLQPKCNLAIDIAITEPRTVIFEAEVVTSWPRSTREAVGQLYEYRFFQVVNPQAGLVFLASKRVPENWIHYLEHDRGIGVAWLDADEFFLSPLAARLIAP